MSEASIAKMLSLVDRPDPAISDPDRLQRAALALVVPSRKAASPEVLARTLRVKLRVVRALEAATDKSFDAETNRLATRFVAPPYITVGNTQVLVVGMSPEDISDRAVRNELARLEREFERGVERQNRELHLRQLINSALEDIAITFKISFPKGEARNAALEILKEELPARPDLARRVTSSFAQREAHRR